MIQYFELAFSGMRFLLTIGAYQSNGFKVMLKRNVCLKVGCGNVRQLSKPVILVLQITPITNELCLSLTRVAIDSYPIT